MQGWLIHKKFLSEDDFYLFFIVLVGSKKFHQKTNTFFRIHPEILALFQVLLCSDSNAPRSTQPSDCGQFGVSEKLTKCLPYGIYDSLTLAYFLPPGRPRIDRKLPKNCQCRQLLKNWPGMDSFVSFWAELKKLKLWQWNK